MTDVPKHHQFIQQTETWADPGRWPDAPTLSNVELDAAGTVIFMAHKNLQSSLPAIHTFRQGETFSTGDRALVRGALVHLVVDTRYVTDHPEWMPEFEAPAHGPRNFNLISYLMQDWTYAGAPTRLRPGAGADGRSSLYVRESFLMIPRKGGLVGTRAAAVRSADKPDAGMMRTMPLLEVGKPYEVPRAREGMTLSHGVRVAAASIIAPSLVSRIPRQFDGLTDN